MRTTIAALVAGGLLAMGAAAPAAAQPDVLSAEGRCDFEINTGAVAAGDHCNRMTMKQDAVTGEVILTFDFASGMVVELEGPGIRVAEWMMMSPGSMRWTNAGGKPQELSNPAGEPNPQITGRCSIALQSAATQLYETYCRMRTPLGDVNITFKIPRADKPKG